MDWHEAMNQVTNEFLKLDPNSKGHKCFVVEDGNFKIVKLRDLQPGMISIKVLTSFDIRNGLKSNQWSIIETRIRQLISKGKL